MLLHRFLSFHRRMLEIELAVLFLVIGLLAPSHAQAPSFTLPNNSTYQGHLNSAPVGSPPAGSG